MIEAQAITRSFGALQVLRGVDLQVKRGEMVVLLGRSGSGKSTLLHILGSLDRPDSGTLRVAGQDVLGLKGQELSRFRNGRVGFIFQFHHLLPEFTALENAMMPGLIAGRPKLEVTRRAEELLDYLGLQSRLEHKPTELSGGEQQRVAVARALLNDPAVILADEPTGNLDSANAREMHDLFLQLKRDFGHTFLIATHSAELASIGDRKIEMSDGRVVGA